ncbi:uncharacterized protein [Aegilops tauschii subsp. strangulata]|uniref:uncharacterized protein n=1 Tax=Aegilops tauschii subsp. strangulata TaxID=200361 RepID=UPI00098A5510|nr:uncharacterized protein LOC109758038 [Aegilops tauschii subsp. strangulata]
MGTAVRIGALARRWRRVPRLLSDLVIDVADLVPHASDRTVDDIMTTYTNATRWLLAPSEQRRIKSLCLTFYLTDPYLHSIGNAVVESGGSTANPLEFTIRADVDTRRVNKAQRAMFGRRFMSFLGACPVAFSWLTSLTLQNICFSDSGISDLLNTCSRLELLSLSRCGSSSHPVLQIDAPTSSLSTLEICDSFYRGVELTSVPKLQRFFCDDVNDFAPISRLRFGYVPCLHNINLSTLHLRYYYDDSRQLFPAFSNLRVLYLSNLETDKMDWTLLVLAAAPLLKKFSTKL